VASQSGSARAGGVPRRRFGRVVEASEAAPSVVPDGSQRPPAPRATVTAAATERSASVRAANGRTSSKAPDQVPVPAEEPTATAAALGLDPDVLAVLHSLRLPSMWVDAQGIVRWAHPSVEAIRLIRRKRVINPDVERLVDESRVAGERLQRDITVRRPGRRQAAIRLRVRVSPMTRGASLVLVEDISEAERLDHVRRDFVANVSHELKTPIGALSLLAEAVREGRDDPEAVDHFSKRMLIESGRLAMLVNDLMDLSRLEGIDPLHPTEPVLVDAAVAQACDDARMAAQDKDIQFLRGGVADLYVEGVESQLVTAVRNLIVNAINYSPPATKVAVTTGLAEGIVTISVTDQGIGIPPTELDRIFERFYRVDPARSRDTGGTGLGLAIVKHVCANHRGDCDVWSRVGEGSTFTIRIPELSPSARPPAARPAHAAKEEQ
jgi:two-component system sensor histidine kinase SenX3